MNHQETASALRAVLPEGNGPFALHEPEITDIEKRYVQDCLDSGWVSYLGAYVDDAERRLKDLTGAADCVVLVNGTAALQLALRLAGVGPGEEVLMPSLTFIATANTVHHCGAIPHFVDCSLSDFGVDAAALDDHLNKTAESRDGQTVNRQTGRPIRAFLPVHIFGTPADLDALDTVCARWKIPLVEDAAEALGSHYKGKPVGGHGHVATLSFNGNKIVTSGGGGALLLPTQELGERARHLATTAKTPHPWRFDHDEAGYNFRLPNLNAALLCAQLDRLDLALKEKTILAERYRQAVTTLDGLTMPGCPDDRTSNHWLNAVLVDQTEYLEPLLQALHDQGVLARRCWTPMHMLPIYRDCPKAALPNTEDLFERLLCLPSSPQLARTV